MPLWLIVILLLTGATVTPVAVDAVAGDQINPETAFGLRLGKWNVFYVLERAGETEVATVLSALSHVHGWFKKKLVEFNVALAAERLKELNETCMCNATQHYKPLLDEYARCLAEAVREAKTMNDTALLKLVANATAQQMTVLERVQERVRLKKCGNTAEVVSVLEQVREQVRKGHETVISVLGKRD